MELKCKEFDHKKNLDQQRELFYDAFPEVTDASKDGYYWLFHSYPNDKNSSFEYCSYLNNEMVGYYAAIPYRYKIGNTETDVGMVCGVMTSSKHRGKGIFTNLGHYSTNELAKKVPFTTGYPIRKAVIPGHLKVGWKIVFELPLYMKFIKTKALLNSKFPKLAFLSTISDFFISIYNLITYPKSNFNYSIQKYNNINDIIGYNLFVSDWVKSVPNALIKDSNFAQWRYSRPNRKYFFIVAYEGDKIVGFASYCPVVKEGVPSYCLLDLSVLPEHFKCLNLIYKTIFQEAKSNNVEAIMLMQSKISASKYKLLQNGFLKSPYKFHLIIKNLTNRFTNEQLFKEENWHLMWVDSDDL